MSLSYFYTMIGRQKQFRKQLNCVIHGILSSSVGFSPNYGLGFPHALAQMRELLR
jgi:hypothetical protein